MYSQDYEPYPSMFGISSQPGGEESAQDPTLGKGPGFDMGVGLFSTVGFGISVLEIEDYKNKPEIAYWNDLGVSFYMVPFGKLGFMLDLHSTTRGFTNYKYDDENDESKFMADYFCIGPKLYLGGFYLGYNYLSASGLTKEVDGRENNMDAAQDDAGEIALGGIIPLFENLNHRVNMNINATYMLDDNTFSVTPAGDYQPVSLSLGISWYFKIGSAPMEVK